MLLEHINIKVISGVETFRKEISNFYKLHYNCDLNHQSEILPLIGSKEGIFHISMSFLSMKMIKF